MVKTLANLIYLSFFEDHKFQRIHSFSNVIFYNIMIHLLVNRRCLCCGTYYGLTWKADSPDKRMSLIISGLVELPAYAIIILVLDRLGRKKIFCGSMLFAGLSLLISIAVIPENREGSKLSTHGKEDKIQRIFLSGISWPFLICNQLGKLAITISYGTIYVFSTEQFPTSVRNVGLGFCSTFGRVGAIIAPYIMELVSFVF